jgi:uncharacterized damage-inducible protein DinB
MAYGVGDMIEVVRASRRHFLKHLQGVRSEQWDWKPYPNCRSIREILAHMVSNDRIFMEVLDKGAVADYTTLEEEERDIAKLLNMLSRSHESLCAFLRLRYGNAPLDSEVPFFGGKEKLGTAISAITHEDYYHSGQIAFIRMATDPSWDYYVSIYGKQE